MMLLPTRAGAALLVLSLCLLAGAPSALARPSSLRLGRALSQTAGTPAQPDVSPELQPGVSPAPLSTVNPACNNNTWT